MRLAKDMPHKDLPVPQDATFPGGLCLITMAPERPCILLAPTAQARAQPMGQALMAAALAPLHCRVIPSTREEASGLLAYVEHSLEAHHSPDVFPGQHELVQAVSGPMAAKERAALKVVSDAAQPLERLQSQPPSPGDEPDKPRPGRPPKNPGSLEQAEQALDAAKRERERLAGQREQVHQRIRGIGHDDHFVDLKRGVRRNGRLIAADMQGRLDAIRTVAQQEGLSQSSLERLDKAKRVLPNMQATIEFVSGYVRQQVKELDLTPTVSFAMHAKLIPAYYLDRVAQTRPIAAGAPLRDIAERLRASLFAPGGVFSALSAEAQTRLHDEAKRLAAVFQRSSANVEGRNGS